MRRYGSREEYLRQFGDCVEQQVSQKWISRTDGEKMKAWAAEAAGKVAGKCK